MSSAFADSEFEETVDSQLTLGTASLLSIFFGLVMICGIFFGFGYSYGRRSFGQSLAIAPKPSGVAPAQTVNAQTSTKPIASAPAPLSLAPVALPDLQTPEAAISKPSAPAPMVLPEVPVTLAHTGKPALKTVQPAPATVASLTPAPVAPSSILRQVLSKPSAIHPVMEEPTVGVPYAHRVGISPNALRSPSTPYIYTPPFYVHTHGSSHHPVFTATHDVATQDAVHAMVHDTLATPHEVLVVQIAAMSRQDDAEVLASSLRKRGFATSIHNDAQDSLYHVQVGPYQRNVALAARQRLIANGYNAVLK